MAKNGLLRVLGFRGNKSNYYINDRQCVQLLELKHMLRRTVYPYASGNWLADSPPDGFTESEPFLTPQPLLIEEGVTDFALGLSAQLTMLSSDLCNSHFSEISSVYAST